MLLQLALKEKLFRTQVTLELSFFLLVRGHKVSIQGSGTPQLTAAVMARDSESRWVGMDRQHVLLQSRISGKLFGAMGTLESFLGVNSSSVHLQALLLRKFFITQSALHWTDMKLFMDAKHIPAKVHLGTVGAAETPLSPLMNPDVAQKAAQV
jgi:hypothetical protein